MSISNLFKACLIFAVIFQFCTAQDYCNLRSCPAQSHTMCLFSTPNPSSACVEFSGGLTNEEKQTIVLLHNEMRQRVASGQETRGLPGPQPAATNMQILEWDEELAAIAQRWVNQCTFGHDQCRNVERFPVGQNVAIQGTTGVNTITVSQLILPWYNEVTSFNAQAVSRFTGTTGENGRDIGHYTQLVWATTNKIGCGLAKYTSNGFRSSCLVCNYGPSGNFVNRPVYETSTSTGAILDQRLKSHDDNLGINAVNQMLPSPFQPPSNSQPSLFPSAQNQLHPANAQLNNKMNNQARPVNQGSQVDFGQGVQLNPSNGQHNNQMSRPSSNFPNLQPANPNTPQNNPSNLVGHNNPVNGGPSNPLAGHTNPSLANFPSLHPASQPNQMGRRPSGQFMPPNNQFLGEMNPYGQIGQPVVVLVNPMGSPSGLHPSPQMVPLNPIYGNLLQTLLQSPVGPDNGLHEWDIHSQENEDFDY